MPLVWGRKGRGLAWARLGVPPGRPSATLGRPRVRGAASSAGCDVDAAALVLCQPPPGRAGPEPRRQPCREEASVAPERWSGPHASRHPREQRRARRHAPSRDELQLAAATPRRTVPRRARTEIADRIGPRRVESTVTSRIRAERDGPSRAVSWRCPQTLTP